jgi:RHS repeat-associated protein
MQDATPHSALWNIPNGRNDEHPSYYRARYYDQATGRFLREDEVGNDEGMNLYLYVGNSALDSRDPTGFYKLKGFPADKAAQMDVAVHQAIAKLQTNCPSCAGSDGPKIAKQIQNATFVYKPDSKDCGETGLFTFFRFRDQLGIGPLAFDPKACCMLPSTITHEAVHSLTYLDNKAFAIEQKCFGCTDPRKQ